MRDRLHRLKHLLESNSMTCEKIANKASLKSALNMDEEQSRSVENRKVAKTYCSEIELQKRRVQTLLHRLDAVASSVSRHHLFEAWLTNNTRCKVY